MGRRKGQNGRMGSSITAEYRDLLGTFRYQSITLAGCPVPHCNIIPGSNSNRQNSAGSNQFTVYKRQI
jgi:hypothetical protein